MKRIISDEKRNQIYAGVLCALMFFWTIASVLGLIAFFRGKEESSAFNVVGASADVPADLIDTVPGANYFNISAMSNSNDEWSWYSAARSVTFKGNGDTSFFIGNGRPSSITTTNPLSKYLLDSFLQDGETYIISYDFSATIDGVPVSNVTGGISINGNTYYSGDVFVYNRGVASFWMFTCSPIFSPDVTYRFSNIRINKGTTAYPFMYYFYFDADEIYDLGYQTGVSNGADPDGTFQEGYQAGFSAGKTQGYNEGFSQGKVEGMELGNEIGYNNGLEQGYQDGFAVGEEEGYQSGYTEGETAGREEGYQSGYTEGETAGREEGYQSGYVEGEEEGYQSGYTEGETVGREQGYQDGFADGGLRSKVGIFKDCGLRIVHFNTGNILELSSSDLEFAYVNDGLTLSPIMNRFLETYPNCLISDVYYFEFKFDLGVPYDLFQISGFGNSLFFLNSYEIRYLYRDGVGYFSPSWSQNDNGSFSIKGSPIVSVGNGSLVLSGIIDTFSFYVKDLGSYDVSLIDDISGYELGRQTGFNNGYDLGFTDGEYVGKTDGYKEGQNAGYKEGYNVGKIDGIESANDYSFIGLLSAVVDVPVRTFTSLFDFNFLGINLAQFFLSLLSVCFVLVVVKLII